MSAKNGILGLPAPSLCCTTLRRPQGPHEGQRPSLLPCRRWNIGHPKKDSGLTNDQRVITIGKSRPNRSGESLLQTQNDDLTVSLVESKRAEEMQTRAGSVAERIMNRLTKNDWVTRQDLNADPLVGGSVSAIKGNSD